MAKMVGMNVVVKEGWTKKAIALLSENLTEEEYKAALNEHLSFEIDSAINLRKAREILMRVWYRDTEGVEKMQQEGRELVIRYPDHLAAINWCMTALVFPAFADIARLMGKMFEFQDVITTTQIKQKMFDEWGETGTLQTVVAKIIGTMREIGGIRSEKTGRQEAASIEVKNDDVVSFMIRVAMTLDGSSYYAFSSLTDFPFLFPFKYRVSKEMLMQDDRFVLSTFDSTLSVALKEREKEACPMKFTMKLNASPFAMIASGEKTIELRLYDEKRRQISVGDTIRFSDINNASRTLLTRVKELFVFDSFDALYKALPLTECGYTAETVQSASPSDMRKYYTQEQEKKYGVLGIKVELIR